MNQPNPTQPTIQLIVVDIDGTLLNSQHQLSARNERALKAAVEKGIHIVLATGKTYLSCRGLIEKLNLTSPGIYMQGTVVVQPDGSVRHQYTLDAAVVRQVITFAEDRGHSMVLYSGARILVRKLTRRVEELTTLYGEPMPEAIGPLQNILDVMPVNKLVAINAHDARAITALRWQLGTQINGGGKLLQAGVPDMLEVLPVGVSKGTALKALLKDLKIPAQHALAVGDAENDVDMIQLAGVGVAVGNAAPKVQASADYVVATNDADGVAEAIERFVLPPPEAPEPSANPVSEVENP